MKRDKTGQSVTYCPILPRSGLRGKEKQKKTTCVIFLSYVYLRLLGGMGVLCCGKI